MILKLKEEQKKMVLNLPKKVTDFIKDFWGDFPESQKGRENIFILHLDVKLQLIELELHSQGTLSESICYPREILKTSLNKNTGNIIMVHNHPSGISYPSNDDKNITNKLKNLMDIVEIKVLDHVIIGEENKYFSFQEHGII